MARAARKPAYAREPDDWYVEPPVVTEALFDAERFVGTIWDPAAGQGTIPAIARARGYTAYGTDLLPRERSVTGGVNFLSEPAWTYDIDNIVTNPPFRHAELFVRRALDLARLKVAIFARLAFLETEGRLPFWRELPPARVLVVANRILCPPGSKQDVPKDVHGRVAYCWLIWDHDHRGPTQLDWIEARGRLAAAEVA